MIIAFPSQWLYVVSLFMGTLYSQAPSILYVWGTDDGSYAH